MIVFFIYCFNKRDKTRVETRPIKGTRPRGKTPTEDNRLNSELTQSKKDDAELSMVVDLLRNDIGKVCKAGSVRVAQHKRLEAYENVYHLVSIVEGTLYKDCDGVDLIEATFPGGDAPRSDPWRSSTNWSRIGAIFTPVPSAI